MNRRHTWIVVATLVLGPAATWAQDSGSEYPRGKISGYIFGDVYYNVSGDPEHRYNSSGADSAAVNISNSSSSPKVIGRDLNGIQIRRVYFQADNDLSARLSTRFRLEADSKSLTSDGKIGVNVKAAYLMAKNVIPRGSFGFGILPTPVKEGSEKLWAYRSIEKTIADFRGLGSSADLGVKLIGHLDDKHRIGYDLMIGDGTGQKPETNRYKKAYMSMPLKPTGDLQIEPFADYEWGADGADKATYKIFAGYEFERGGLGLEVVDRVEHMNGVPNREPFGVSMFGRWKMKDDLQAFARMDRWQPDTRAADRIDTDYYIAGLDWTPYKDVHVMPNVLATQYRARGAAIAPPHHDVQARVTMYFKWSKP